MPQLLRRRWGFAVEEFFQLFRGWGALYCVVHFVRECSHHFQQLVFASERRVEFYARQDQRQPGVTALGNFMS